MKQTTERKHGYIEALRESNMPIVKELVKCGYVSYIDTENRYDKKWGGRDNQRRGNWCR